MKLLPKCLAVAGVGEIREVVALPKGEDGKPRGFESRILDGEVLKKYAETGRAGVGNRIGQGIETWVEKTVRKYGMEKILDAEVKVSGGAQPGGYLDTGNGVRRETNVDSVIPGVDMQDEREGSRILVARLKKLIQSNDDATALSAVKALQGLYKDGLGREETLEEVQARKGALVAENMRLEEEIGGIEKFIRDNGGTVQAPAPAGTATDGRGGNGAAGGEAHGNADVQPAGGGGA